MIRWLKTFTAILISFGILYPGVYALTVEETQQLKNNGVSDETIQVIVQEKTFETAAFSLEEIVALKQSGVGEKALQAIIKEGSFMKNAQPRTYGQTTRTIDRVTTDDLLRMKEAGFSDEVIQAVVAYNSPASGDAQRREAYDLLKSMGVVVDQRKGIRPRFDN
jgi:hypothetical protein